jgi:hypothetical protein
MPGPVMRKRAADPDVADIAGLMGPLGVPATAMAGIGKALKMNPEVYQQVQELLGRPIEIGKRLMRLSSMNPEKNVAILHDATKGERISTSIDDLWKAFSQAGQPSEQIFPEGRVMSQMGERVNLVDSFGPKGGQKLSRRKIPDTASR